MGSPPAPTSRRPRANQLSCGSCPCAIATKLHSLRLRGEQIVVARVAPALGHVVADRQQVTRPVVEEVVLHLRELARLQRQLLDAAAILLARVRRHAARLPVSPPLRAAWGSPSNASEREQRRCSSQRGPALRGQRPCPPARARSGAVPFDRRASAAASSALQQQADRRSVAGGDWRAASNVLPACAASSAGTEPPLAVTRMPKVSAEAFEPAREDRLIGERQQARAQRQQMAGQVAAVHRGNVDAACSGCSDCVSYQL